MGSFHFAHSSANELSIFIADTKISTQREVIMHNLPKASRPKKIRLREQDILQILFVGASAVLVIGFFTYLNAVTGFVIR